ncbi:proton/glutamate symport protein [hydrocarbon metagenome]|uniref:Proton/glutamate symport protein n=1 Tax=hydrocarbon metagenome TaxID=938273 RepID=A0A0W8FY80_9ZZZZ
MRRVKLHWQILIGFIVGTLIGLYLTEHVQYVTWLGEVFLRALKMVIVPLILSSIISGVANIGSGESLGRLGMKTITYYLSTSTLAILVGLVLVNLLQPGVGSDLGLTKSIDELAIVKESFGDTLIKIIPTNIFEAFIEGDMLSIIFFSILFGFFVTKVDEKYSTHLTEFFNATFEVVMKITMLVIRFAPLGILGIVAGIVAEQAGDTEALLDIVGRLGLYMIAVLLALVFHAAITLPLILKLIGRVDPWLHFKAMTTPLLTAFSTSSSNATLPLTMDAVENEVGVSNKITSFTLPLGATINMDGTALYECIAAIFIAQAYGIHLGFLEQVIVVVTALLASIGAAGIPMAGLVTITIILSAVGLPLEGVGLILSVDRILDMCRTTVNVWSDSCGAVVIAKTEGETLNIEKGA